MPSDHPLTGQANNAIALAGSSATAVNLLGSPGIMATRTDIGLYKGEDATLTVTMNPVTNITGWALAFTVKKNPGDAAALVSKTTANGGITLTNPTGGVFTVSLASADTLALGPGTFTYDIQRTNAGSRTVVCVGTLTILPEVTL